MTMTKDAKISIITPLYNCKRYLQRFLTNVELIENFDLANLMLIYCGDDEEELEMLRECNRKHYNVFLYTPDYMTLYESWNWAVQRAASPYVINSNVDDLINPTILYSIVMELENGADIVYGNNIVVTDLDTTWQNFTLEDSLIYPSSQFSISKMLRGNLIHNCVAWNLAIHEDVGYFDTSLRTASDYEFWLRVATAGKKIVYMPDTFSLYYYNPCGISTDVNTATTKILEEIRVQNKYRKLIGDKK